MIYSALMKMDAYSSFFTYPSLQPKTQAMLSVRIRMWQFLSFLGMVKKGMRIAIISKVVVLFPNLFLLLSVAIVMKGLGQNNWYPKVVLPSMSEP